MSVLKKTWKELIEKHYLAIEPFFEDDDTIPARLCEKIDSEISDLYPKVSDGHGGEVDVTPNYLSGAFWSLTKFFISNNNNIWLEMPIWMSSYRYNDSRIFTLLYTKLIEYLGFYNRILTDEGVAKKLVTHRTFEASSDSSGSSKDYDSETPQIQLTNFDEAINYASRLGKTEDSATKDTDGSTDFELSKVEYDEALKNLKLTFYDELVEYMLRLPEIVYNYYCLDTMPVTDLVKEYHNYLKDLYEYR